MKQSKLEKYLKSFEDMATGYGFNRTAHAVHKIIDRIYPSEPKLSDFGIGSAVVGLSTEDVNRKNKF